MHVSDAANQSATYLDEHADVLIAGNAPHQQTLAQHIKHVVAAIKDAGDTETKIKNLQDSVLMLHDERDKTRADRDAANAELATLRTNLESLTRERDTLAAELNALRTADAPLVKYDEHPKQVDEPQPGLANSTQGAAGFGVLGVGSERGKAV